MIHGIRKLNDIKLRCHCEPGGCWEWRQAVQTSGRKKPEPRVWFALENKSTTLARAAWKLAGNPPVARVWRTCLNPLCGNPAHLMGGTQAEWGAWVAAQGYLKGDPIRSAVNKAKAASRRKLTDEQIAAIRESNESGEALAKVYGVSPTAISRVRRRVYTPILRGASVFSLGARV